MNTVNVQRVAQNSHNRNNRSFVKKAGSAVLALLVASFLLPAALFQPSQALADVGITTTVSGKLTFRGCGLWDEEESVSITDMTFNRGVNKIVVDRNAYNGRAWAKLDFEPEYRAGQDNVATDWASIPTNIKYSMNTISWSCPDDLSNLNVLSLAKVTPDGNSCILELRSDCPGAAPAEIVFDYVNPETGVRYNANLRFMVYAIDGPNEAIDVFTPSQELTVWAGDTFSANSDRLTNAYYYEYDCDGHYGYNGQEYLLGCATNIGDAPATFDALELFDISIADPSVVSSVSFVYKATYIDGVLQDITGPDAHTYSLEVMPISAGTTDITFSLKQHPEKSATVKVTVRADHPEVVVADHDMQINAPQKILVAGSSSSDASPVYFPVPAEYLYYRMSWARPFITQIVSSNTDVVNVVPISNPAYAERHAPYQLIPLSVGTANMTLTDCYGKTYAYTITVKPDPNEGGGDEGIKIESLKILSDGNDVTQDVVVLSTRDMIGRQLVAMVNEAAPDASMNVTWESSSPNIATVDAATGLVTPVSASYDEATGRTTDCRIRVTANGEVTRYCDVIVEAAQGLCAADPDSPLGAAAIRLNNALPQDVLDELDTVALSISPVSAGTQDAIDSATSDLTANGATVQGVYDIHFVNKSDGAEHAWNKPQTPITVQIPMTDEMRELHSHGTLRFYHIDPDTGTRTAMRTWVDKDLTYLYFETTHFSPFALVFEPESSEGANGPNSGDDTGDDGDGTGDDSNGNGDGNGGSSNTDGTPDNTGNDGSNGTPNPPINNGNGSNNGSNANGGSSNLNGSLGTAVYGPNNADNSGTNGGTSNNITTTAEASNNGTTASNKTNTAGGSTTTVGDQLVKTGDSLNGQIAIALLGVFFALTAIVIVNRKRFGFDIKLPSSKK